MFKRAVIADTINFSQPAVRNTELQLALPRFGKEFRSPVAGTAHAPQADPGMEAKGRRPVLDYRLG